MARLKVVSSVLIAADLPAMIFLQELGGGNECAFMLAWLSLVQLIEALDTVDIIVQYFLGDLILCRPSEVLLYAHV